MQILKREFLYDLQLRQIFKCSVVTKIVAGKFTRQFCQYYGQTLNKTGHVICVIQKTLNAHTQITNDWCVLYMPMPHAYTVAIIGYDAFREFFTKIRRYIHYYPSLIVGKLLTWLYYTEALVRSFSRDSQF